MANASLPSWHPQNCVGSGIHLCYTLLIPLNLIVPYTQHLLSICEKYCVNLKTKQIVHLVLEMLPVGNSDYI